MRFDPHEASAPRPCVARYAPLESLLLARVELFTHRRLEAARRNAMSESSLRRAACPPRTYPQPCRRAPPVLDYLTRRRSCGSHALREEHPERRQRNRHLQRGHAQPLQLRLPLRREAEELQPQQRRGLRGSRDCHGSRPRRYATRSGHGKPYGERTNCGSDHGRRRFGWTRRSVRMNGSPPENLLLVPYGGGIC